MSGDGRQTGRAPAGAAGRVAAVHRQSRPTLGLAVAFSIAAGVATALPHRTGTWLPMHLFLLGGVLLAISAATQLLAVTWGAAPAPAERTVAVQRALVAVGAAGLALARERAWPTPVLAAAGLAVVGGLLLLGVLLWQLRAAAIQDRFARSSITTSSPSSSVWRARSPVCCSPPGPHRWPPTGSGLRT